MSKNKNKPDEVVVEVPVEEVPAEAPVVVEEVAADYRIKVAIKSLEFKPRGKPSTYRAGGLYVLDAAEAKELDAAGIAIIVEDPCIEPLTFPELSEE